MFGSLNQNVLAMALADTGASSGAYGVWLNKPYSRGELVLDLHRPCRPTQGRAADAVRRTRPAADAGRGPGARRPGPPRRDQRSSSTRRSRPRTPPCSTALDNDRRLDEHLLATVGDAQHGTSTCRMGDPGDLDTVVDPACRVLGVQGLRVVDASIFPSVTRANTNLATIMTAELMADRIDA